MSAVIPDVALETGLASYLGASITTVQVVGSRGSVTLTMPRIVVKSTAEQDAALAQAGVYPCAVEVDIMHDARAGYDPSAIYAACDRLLWDIPITLTGVTIFGRVIDATQQTEGDDAITRTYSMRVFARL